MATQTVATFNNGLVEFQVDYDATYRLTALRCINNDDHTVYGEAVQESNGRKYSGSFLAGTNTYIPIPTNTAQRITVTVDPEHPNRLLGVRWAFEG